MKITYQSHLNNTAKVNLDGRHVGTIKNTASGWQYIPKGKRTSQGGATFATLDACKASLEVTEPRYLGPEANKVLQESHGPFDDLTAEEHATIAAFAKKIDDSNSDREPSENTYWNNKGKHKEFASALDKLVPAMGEVPNADINPALETYRIARNCYYDLYNNGLCNRGQEFTEVFDFNPDDIGEPEGMYVRLTQELIDRTESKMDEIILAAYAQHCPELPAGLRITETPRQSGPSVPCPHCGGSGKVPTRGKPVPR